MRRVLIRRPGGYDRLEVEEFSCRPPGRGELQVVVRAAGVNYADCTVRMGLYSSAQKYVGWPITPGFEFSGEVAAVGEAVEQFAAGDRVFGVIRFGGYASHVTVPETQLFPLPESMSFEAAAAFPAVHLTAYYALFELAHPRPGNDLLVHSAAGGVGGALLQLARIGDCRAVGVVGHASKVDVARERGAEVVIDKSRGDLWRQAESAAPAGYHVICDANGVETLRQSYNHLRSTGKLIVYGFHTMMSKGKDRPNWAKLGFDYLRTPRFNPFLMTEQNRSVMAFNLSYLFEENDILRDAFDKLLGWYREGRLSDPAIATYPLDAVADAHADLEGARTVGKLVLVP